MVDQNLMVLLSILHSHLHTMQLTAVWKSLCWCRNTVLCVSDCAIFDIFIDLTEEIGTNDAFLWQGAFNKCVICQVVSCADKTLLHLLSCACFPCTQLKRANEGWLRTFTQYRKCTFLSVTCSIFCAASVPKNYSQLIWIMHLMWQDLILYPHPLI